MAHFNNITNLINEKFYNVTEAQHAASIEHEKRKYPHEVRLAQGRFRKQLDWFNLFRLGWSCQLNKPLTRAQATWFELRISTKMLNGDGVARGWEGEGMTRKQAVLRVFFEYYINEKYMFAAGKNQQILIEQLMDG